MANILETIMLICFGLSWPVSAYKNYQARTAKSTSLSFILLIMTGYVAGIGAKLVNQNYSYVLGMYFFNFLMISLNLFVYIRNRRLDLSEKSIFKKEITTYAELHA